MNKFFGVTAILSLLLLSVFALAENETKTEVFKLSRDSRFEFKALTMDEFMLKLHRSEPTTEKGWKNLEYQTGLYCEWRRIEPQTKWYLGTWNRGKDDCLPFGDSVKPKATKVSAPVCREKEVCETVQKCGTTCDEYEEKCIYIFGKKICSDVCVDIRTDGRYDCEEYIQKYECDRYEGSGYKKHCVEGHWEDTSICKKWEQCSSKLGFFYNDKTCSTETVCN